MSEYTILYTAVGALVGLVASALLYALGGRDGKWKRRFVASAILSTTVNLCSLVMGKWTWELLCTYPLLVIGFSLGYGVNNGDVMWKVIRRALYTLGSITSGLLFIFFVSQAGWLVFVPHVGVALWSIWLGVKNPISAAAEEVFICTLLNLGLCMYPFMV